MRNKIAIFIFFALNAVIWFDLGLSVMIDIWCLTGAILWLLYGVVVVLLARKGWRKVKWKSLCWPFFHSFWNGPRYDLETFWEVLEDVWPLSK